MREFREVLNEAFDRHSAALTSNAESEITVEIVTEIRRKRGWRAAGVAAGSVLAVSAIVAAAITVPQGFTDGFGPGNRGAEVPAIQEGAPAWCDLSSYPAPNPEAFGPARFTGRTYSNFETNEFRFVAPDGTVTELETNEYADQMPMPWSTLAVDDFFGGGGGGGPYLGPDGNPQLAYEWTTVASEDVPAGVNAALLAEVHTLTLGFAGTGLEPNVAGADAVVESVFTWDDGTQDVVRIGRGEPGATVRTFDGLVSAAIRATLPTGEVYEITSYYDASMTYEAACMEAGVSAAPSPSPTVDDRLADFAYGPYLLGPESALFACGAPLPSGLEATPISLEYREGTFYDPEMGTEFEFGQRGIALEVALPNYPNPDTVPPAYAGWGGSSGGDEGGPITGHLTFIALVWVDEQGRIVARQVTPDPADDTSRVAGQDDQMAMNYGLGESLTVFVGDVASLAVPCEGVEAFDAASAELAIIYGQGASSDSMVWQIYRP